LTDETGSESSLLPGPLLERLGPTLGIRRWIDLALHLPLRYQDEATLTRIAHLEAGNLASATGTIVSSEVQERPRKCWQLVLADETGELVLRWLHFYPSQVQKYQPGMLLKATGQVRRARRSLEIIHPKLQLPHPGTGGFDAPDATAPASAAISESGGRLTPIYSTINDIKQIEWQRWQALLPPACYDDLLASQSDNRLTGLGLPSWADALRWLHQDATVDTLDALNTREHPAWRRIKFDELVAQQLALQLVRQTRSAWRAPAFANPTGIDQRLIDKLPFSLTQAQQSAWGEIQRDLGKTVPMQRLLQGDVGSGKTIIAALACAEVAASGAQAALLAPTEILAEQHMAKLQPLFEALGLRCGKLVGALSKKQKARITAQLATDDIDIVIGTHALIQSTVRFRKLGLVVVDEQHRFGVQQRLAIIQGDPAQALAAHQLMMSATPIPRTLAHTYLADLDISVLDEKPPGRQKIVTKLVDLQRRDELMLSLAAEVQAGRQIYWVCPLIEENEELQLQAAEQTHAELSATLPAVRIGLLHGKMATVDKAAVMQAFIARELDILVSTTVIEVGVDVPNASIMVVEQAERFGLAQLHQLRGRVGRGGTQSVCVLLYGKALSQIGRERLKALHQSDDGFWLAEKDLELRGPGELLGTRQSGLPMLRYADPVRDIELVRAARHFVESVAVPGGVARRLTQRWFSGEANWLT
jgi:ATP-dependent DNA helicase RecG